MGDLDNLPAMTAGMTGCAAVIHAAAKVDQWGEWSVPQYYRERTENVAKPPVRPA